MKKLIILLTFLPFITKGQSHSCCSKSATEHFGQMAMLDGFAAGHEAPVPFAFSPAAGEMIKFPCNDKIDANAFLVKSEKATNNWLIMIHEWWGLNDYIKQEAERLQADLANVNIIAIDLYDAKIAETPAVAQQLLASLKDERARNIIQGALLYAGNKAKVYTLGWCMGGGWALQTSLMAESKSSGCVLYYGMPETDPDKLKKLSGDVLGIFASKDEWISPAVMNQFKEDMKEAKKNLVTKVYDADHAFANPSNPKYDKTAAGDARKLAIEFLKKRMK